MKAIVLVLSMVLWLACHVTAEENTRRVEYLAGKLYRLKTAIRAVRGKLEISRTGGATADSLRKQENMLEQLVREEELCNLEQQKLIAAAATPPAFYPGQLLRTINVQRFLGLRAWPDKTANISKEIPPWAASIQYLGGDEVSGWSHVSYEDDPGWVPSEHLVPTGPLAKNSSPRAGSAYIVCGTTHDHYLSLRNLPGRGSRELVRISEGAVLSATGEQSGRWFEVVHEGRRGWVHSAYLCLER